MNSPFSAIVILILLLSTTVVKASQQKQGKASNSGVLIVDEANLTNTLEQNHHLVLYFSQDDCKYCQQFSEIFTLVSKLHAGVARFSKITLTPETAKLFEQYQIKSTPTVLAFQKKQLFKYRYQPIGSGNILSVHFFKWVQRLFTQLKSWDQQQNNPHQLIVHCNSTDLIQFWKDIERSQLWLDVYCGEEDLLSQNLVIVQEYGRRVQAWQLQSNSWQQIQGKIRRLIKAYKYKYVTHWNTAVIQQIFTYNVSAFVLLINNQSLSHQTYKYYQNIKKRWYQNSYNYEPTIFAVSDLSLKTYQTLKLKHYLTAYVPYFLRGYYYPILAFIHRGQVFEKYILNLTAQKTEAVVEDFISRVNNQVIKGNKEEESANRLQRWLSEQKDINELASKGGAEGQRADVEKQGQGLLKIGLQQTWKYLLSMYYEHSFFVYVTWRFDYKMQSLQQQFNQWWKVQANRTQFAPHHSKYKIFIHLPHVIDIPTHPGLTYQYLPALFFINRGKQITKIEGVTDLQKVKTFINEIYQKELVQQAKISD